MGESPGTQSLQFPLPTPFQSVLSEDEKKRCWKDGKEGLLWWGNDHFQGKTKFQQSGNRMETAESGLNDQSWFELGMIAQD